MMPIALLATNQYLTIIFERTDLKAKRLPKS